VNRDQIAAIVIKHLKANVDGLDDQEIDTSKSMFDYGASSLDLVEIVNASMREIKINVPRTQLANLKDIDGLVGVLLSIKAA
jgi:polyketide biosynthesis acyl carrier protein